MLGMTHPGTQVGALALRAEVSVQITGASMGTEGKKPTVSIQFCISVGRKSNGKAICYCAYHCGPEGAQYCWETCHPTDPVLRAAQGTAFVPPTGSISGQLRLEPL